MNRVQEIAQLRQRYSNAVIERKHKLANQIFARLKSLVSRQLNAENRQDKKR